MPGNKATEPAVDAFKKHRFVFKWLDGAPIEVPMSDVLDIDEIRLYL